jgi:hypothetical protein
VPHEEIHVTRLRQQGHVAQSDNDKCQDEVGISGMRKLRI